MEKTLFQKFQAAEKALLTHKDSCPTCHDFAGLCATGEALAQAVDAAGQAMQDSDTESE